MSVLIKGGRIVTAADDYVGDVYCENGTVSLIGESLDVSADKVIDATGKYVLPGAIDPHTHLEMFFGPKCRATRIGPRIEKYIKQRRAEGAAEASIRAELAFLDRAFNLAVRAEMLPRLLGRLHGAR